MISISKSLKNNKAELLEYYRERAKESFEEVIRTFARTEYKKQASAMNKSIIETKNNILATFLQKAGKEHWETKDILESILMITYTNYIVMIEFRNMVWSYDYMTFSRRIGELWQPFCKLCFDYPLNEVEIFVPPLFSKVKAKLTAEIETYIDKLTIKDNQKTELKTYYSKVWSLVTSGEIKLELDLHFIQSGTKYIVDFKSGFGSNEKGNTNRLLLVASVYQTLEDDYECMLMVRANEDSNNHYFQTLKNSGVWSAYCGEETYNKIKEFTGFNIKSWIADNIIWQSDLKQETIDFFVEKDLVQYLYW